MDLVTLTLAKKGAKQYIDDIMEGFGKGISYKGAVEYYNDLPNNASIGDAYVVLYQGESGNTPSGVQYVWGNNEELGTNSWVQLGINPNSFEKINNKVSAIDENSTDEEYPSAKCVYDLVGNIEELLAELDTGSGV